MKTVIRPIALVAFISLLALLAGGTWFGLRNREHLGASWNCMRFQKEAPPNLRALHAAELKFREAHGHFTTDLVALGFTPQNGPAVPSVFYGYGFTHPSKGPLAEGEDPSRSLALEKKATEMPTYDFPTTTASADRFLATAVAMHFEEAGPDIWTIDETGRLTHEENGCWE